MTATEKTKALQAVPSESEARAVADVVSKHLEPRTVTVSDGDRCAQVLVTAEGLSVHPIKPYLDEYLDAPERRKGTAHLEYLRSLIDHAKRFADDDSALFAVSDRSAPKLICVLDYHRSGPNASPRFGEHRADHAFPLSDEWKVWMAADKNKMGQQDFAEFLEDRICDVIVPDDELLGEVKQRDAGGDFGPKTAREMLADYAQLLGGRFATPSDLVTLSRGLSVHASHKVKNAVNLKTGEASIQYVEEHTDDQGQPIKVPNLFLIGIPVFRAGPLYRIAVRLRYRLGGAGISWFFELYRHDVVFDAALTESCEAAQKQTGLPLFYGRPE